MVWVVIVVGLALVGAAGLLARTAPHLTGDRLSAQVSTDFTRRAALQRVLLDDPSGAPAGWVAQCARGGPSQPDSGAGEDWLCSLAPAGVVTGAPLSVEVLLTPAGCYRAHGTEAVLGPPRLTRLDGTVVVNPLLAFDGCLGWS